MTLLLLVSEFLKEVSSLYSPLHPTHEQSVSNTQYLFKTRIQAKWSCVAEGHKGLSMVYNCRNKVVGGRRFTLWYYFLFSKTKSMDIHRNSRAPDKNTVHSFVIVQQTTSSFRPITTWIWLITLTSPNKIKRKHQHIIFGRIGSPGFIPTWNMCLYICIYTHTRMYMFVCIYTDTHPQYCTYTHLLCF